MANIDEQSDYKTQYWFCGVCKTTEECSTYTTMIYHKHESATIILQPLTRQAYAELKTVVSKVKKIRKRDAVRASQRVCLCGIALDGVTTINNLCPTHGYKGLHK